MLQGRISEEYRKPAIAPVAFDFEKSHVSRDETTIALSRLDVLGIVQSAFSEFEPGNGSMIAVKRKVVGEVSEGQLADALRTAIIGAGKMGCACCR
jgi:hypothetical protein